MSFIDLGDPELHVYKLFEILHFFAKAPPKFVEIYRFLKIFIDPILTASCHGIIQGIFKVQKMTKNAQFGSDRFSQKT
jgi:hypothetical protein